METKLNKTCMKNLKMLTIAAAVCLSAGALFTSCNEDETSLPTDNSGIAGTFRLSSFNVPVATDLNADGTPSTNLLSETDCYNANFLRLNSDHTYAKTDNYDDASTGTLTCTDFAETGTWKREGDVITTSSSTTNGYSPYDTVYTYSDASGTLTNQQTEGVYPGYDDFGSLMNITGDINYVFTREATQ